MGHWWFEGSLLASLLAGSLLGIVLELLLHPSTGGRSAYDLGCYAQHGGCEIAVISIPCTSCCHGLSAGSCPRRDREEFDHFADKVDDGFPWLVTLRVFLLSKLTLPLSGS